MKASIYRLVIIWAAVIISIVQVVPTIGWYYILDQEARDARIEKWKQEDLQLLAQRPNYFQRQLHAWKRWAEFDRSKVINFGLDLQGGVHMVIGFDWRELPEAKLTELRDAGYKDADIAKEVQDIILEQVRRRVHDFEADEPIIQALGDREVQVQLPGEKDVERAKQLILKTAQLNFHLVAGPDETARVFAAIENKYPNEFRPLITKPATKGEPIRVPAENRKLLEEVLEKAKKEGVIPADREVLFSAPPKPYQPQFYRLYVVHAETMIDGSGLTSASAMPDSTNPPFWQINFHFSNSAGAEFGKATEAHINEPMAIVIDNNVLSAPVIRDKITTNGQITGQFEGEEARDLAIALNSGSMAVPVHEEFTTVVGASLGQDAVNKGVYSSIVAVALVAVFMIIYYTSGGLIAVISLILNGLFILALMAYFNLTLTLPGIAGLILTIGMAVDANVLIFERMREELKLGHSLISSLEAGYDRAGITILDANITTLIAAAVLYQFGTGPIEGFALTLSIGVITTVFAALVVSRAMLEYLVRNKIVKTIPMMNAIKGQTRFPFLKYGVAATSVSLLIVVGGAAFFVINVMNGNMFGVDFSEGTNLRLAIASDQPVSTGDVRARLNEGGFSNPIVQTAGTLEDQAGTEFLIRVTDISEGANAEGGTTVGQRIAAALAPLSASGTPEGISIVSEQSVGPAVGQRLRNDAVKATISALFFACVYLAFRFEFRFALGAVVAVIHDTLIVLAALAIAGRQISMPVVAAVLTIIGYSLNDTIVIFDRVRENMQLYRGKGMRAADLFDISINQTLSRTILTSLLTLFTVIVLYFFGGESLNDFAFSLIVGMVAGTYSTIFIASPVALLWQRFFEQRRAAAENAAIEKRAAKKSAKKASRKESAQEA